jgi:Putative Ig domain
MPISSVAAWRASRLGVALVALMMLAALLPAAASAAPRRAPTITSAAATTFTVGVAGTFTVTTTGTPIPSIVRTGVALPSGVTFTDNGDRTGTLKGTPAAGTNGSYALTFTASNGNLPNAVQSFTLVVNAAGPSVTINQAAAQPDPTSGSPIMFTVVFSAAVTGFATGDVTITGTTGGTKVGTVSAVSTTRYDVAVTGMTTGGTVIATVAANVALDAGSRPNLASTSTDNQVTWAPVTASITLSTSAPIPPGAHDPVITWGQGFTLGVQFATNGAGRTVQLQGTRDGTAWTTITSLTMDAAGHASYSYRPVTNLFYRAVFAGTTDLVAGVSNQVRTVVREIAILRPTNGGAVKPIARTTSVTFTTTVRPARPDLASATVSFWSYRWMGTSWVLQAKRTSTADTAGLATATFTFPSSGLWYVRSMANPTPYNANSVMSALERYSVN